MPPGSLAPAPHAAPLDKRPAKQAARPASPPARSQAGSKLGLQTAPRAALAAASDKIDTGTVSALDRGLALLQCFSPSQRRLGPTELARMTGIPRPSVTRLAATLVAHRWLQPEPGGERFMLGAGVVTLAQVFLAGLDVRAAARGPMQALAEATGGTVYLAVRDGLEMVIVEACRAPTTMFSARLDVGSRVPMPNSALGRAYLGALPARERDPLIGTLRQARASEWASIGPALAHALEERDHTGCCLSAGEFHREINSVSVAMTGPRGDVLSFNCGGPAFLFTPERLRDEVGPALIEMVQTIAADIGGHAAIPTAIPPSEGQS